MFTMKSIALVIIINRRDRSPVSKIAINNYRERFFYRDNFPHSLKTTYAIHHLPIIMVSQFSIFRFCITAVFLIIQIDKECIPFFYRFTQHSPSSSIRKTHCDPFIPSRYKNKFRISLQCTFPLFFEIKSFFRTKMLRIRFLSIVKTPSDIGNRMFSYTNRHLLRPIRAFMPAISLRSMIQPRPFVFPVSKPFLAFRPCPRLTQREKIHDLFRKAFRIT